MHKFSRYDWEPEIITDCDCIYHRYKNVYICGCGKLVSNSQDDWSEHKLHKNGILIPSEYYWHDDTILTLWDRLSGYGLLPYFDDNFNDVSDQISKLQG